MSNSQRQQPIQITLIQLTYLIVLLMVQLLTALSTMVRIHKITLCQIKADDNQLSAPNKSTDAELQMRIDREANMSEQELEVIS
jgi:hypothetical protein